MGGAKRSAQSANPWLSPGLPSAVLWSFCLLVLSLPAHHSPVAEGGIDPGFCLDQMTVQADQRDVEQRAVTGQRLADAGRRFSHHARIESALQNELLERSVVGGLG